MPHQHVKEEKRKVVAQTIKSSKDLSGFLTMLSKNKKFVVERNPNLSNLKREMLNAEEKQQHYNVNFDSSMQIMTGKVVDNNPNLLLFGQYSHQAPPNKSLSTTTPSTATKTTTTMSQKTSERNCIVCAPNGLITTTALTMNLSAIGPLCTNIGCIGATSNSIGAKEANSRMSRSASPALGTENNTRLNSLKIGDFSFQIFYVSFFA